MKSSVKIALLALAVAAFIVPPRRARAATYPRLETAFSLPNLKGDPFDYQTNDVRVQFRGATGKIAVIPAFFDRGNVWRARYLPSTTGTYRVAGITFNGRLISAKAQPNSWQFSGATDTKLPGIVRLSARNRNLFAFDNGSVNGRPYFPLGHNQAWQTGGLPDIPALFDKMGAAGENWSRVWMNHWDGKNLDWAADSKSQPLGVFNLDVARRWDSIVTAAERNGIAFQLVFQHHGQYSTQVNPNWDDNPYNLKNGGFLTTPNQFFTDARAKTLTKRKLRYSVARWGYSPAILSWELFNEVQFTDAARAGEWPVIAAWHNEMAAFLRAQDPSHHLITTSSSGAVPQPVWAAMDYYQEHLYPADVVTALSEGNSHSEWPRKPFFVGEFGPAGVNDADGSAIHNGLWAGLMSAEAGAPQFWTWDDVEKNDLYFHFRAASNFVKASGLDLQIALKKTAPTLQTTALGALSFGPGGDWGAVKQSDFAVKPGGPPDGIGTLSRFLQGNANRALQPQPLTFRTDFARAGEFIVQIGEVSKNGAHVILSEGDQQIERDFPASDANYKPQGETGRIVIKVPAGAHTIMLKNSGADWASIGNLTLTDYSPTLGAYAIGNDNFAAAWLYNRDALSKNRDSAAATGTLSLPNLKAGRYRATWWDTRSGAALSSSAFTVAAGQKMALPTPNVSRDVAVYVTPFSAPR